MEMINAVGRRKASVARVFLKRKGQITINKKDIKDYMVLDNMQQEILAPLKVAELEGKYDVIVNVNGGFKGQTEATSWYF